MFLSINRTKKNPTRVQNGRHRGPTRDIKFSDLSR